MNDQKMTPAEVVRRIEAGAYSPGAYPSKESCPDQNAFRAAKRAWRVERSRQEQEVLHRDLAEAYGLLEHPKEPKLFELAWNDGENYGLMDVADRYQELAELLK